MGVNSDQLQRVWDYKNPLCSLFYMAHWYIRKLYMQNMNTKQGEINRMAEDNRGMREENRELRDEIRQAYRELAPNKKK